eukprot:Amastigsp_a841680_68.p3 type:complete len:130 gc:universal Amastigsp_a841680_68:591-202(-)
MTATKPGPRALGTTTTPLAKSKQPPRLAAVATVSGLWAPESGSTWTHTSVHTATQSTSPTRPTRSARMAPKSCSSTFVRADALYTRQRFANGATAASLSSLPLPASGNASAVYAFESPSSNMRTPSSYL